MRLWYILLLLAACSKPQEVVVIACNDLLHGCMLPGAVEVKFSRPPSAMQAFGLSVKAPQDAEVHASFQMRGMEMGLNRYRLVRERDHWQSNAMLPACVQGRRDWVLRLEINGKFYEIPFEAG